MYSLANLYIDTVSTVSVYPCRTDMETKDVTRIESPLSSIAGIIIYT